MTGRDADTMADQYRDGDIPFDLEREAEAAGFRCNCGATPHDRSSCPAYWKVRALALARRAVKAVAQSFDDEGCFGECGRMVDRTTGDQIHASMCPRGVAAEIRRRASAPDEEQGDA